MKHLLLLAIVIISFCDLTICLSQCPDGTWTWVSQERVVANFDGQLMCEYDISYCWKEIPGIPPLLFIEIYSWSCVDENCCPQNVNSGLIYRKCAESLVKYNPGQRPWTVPPCQGLGTENVEISWGACHNIEGMTCNEYGWARCKSLYRLCQNNGHVTLTIAPGYPILIDSNCPAGCTPICY